MGRGKITRPRSARLRPLRTLDKLLNWRETPGVPDYIFAMLYLELGEMDKCMDSLAAVVDSRCPWAPLLLSADGSPPGTARHDADAEMKLPVREF